MNDASELLPCPSCGAKAKLVGYYHEGGKLVDVRCTNFEGNCWNSVWSMHINDWQKPRTDAAQHRTSEEK